MKKFLFVLLALTLLAMPAMASVQNIRVSGDIETSYLSRQDFDLGANAATYSQNVFLTQTRLRVDSDLTDKVSATIALINERAWSKTGAADIDIDLNLAYVTMKEMLYSPLTVKLGRQNFAFGNSFVINSAGPNNTAQADSGLTLIAKDLSKQGAQDAVRLTFDYDPLTLDVLYASIDQGLVKGTIKSDNTDLYGMNAAYKFNDENNSMTEAYFWVKDSKTNDDNSKIYMPGVRGSMNVLDGWTLQAEAAMQMGNTDYVGKGVKTDREAYAFQVLSNYLLPFEQSKEYQPVLGLSYTVYSGDKGAGGDNTAWDPMYENQNGGKIYNTLFNASNSHTLGASLTMVPMQDVTANMYYDLLWMDKKVGFDLLQPDGSTAVDTAAFENNDKGKLGQEVGMVVTYDYTEDVQFGARVGWFFPGSHYNASKADNAAEVASQLLLNAKVSF